MKKIFLMSTIVVLAACSKENTPTLSGENNKVKKDTEQTAVALPLDGDSVVAAVEAFYVAYGDYHDGNYNQNNSPDYQVGYGIALLEAAVNAAHYSESESFYADFDVADETSYTMTGTVENEVAYVSEYSLLQKFEAIMIAFSSVDLAPVSDIAMETEVDGNGGFTIKFAPAYRVLTAGINPIGTDGDYKAHVKQKCDYTPDINAAQRLERANFHRYLSVWFYNAETYYCHDENNVRNQIPNFGWDYDIYYEAINSKGHLWPVVPDPNLTGYESYFLGGEFAVGVDAPNGIRRWAHDCVHNPELLVLDNNVKSVLSDFKSSVYNKVTRVRVYSKESNESQPPGWPYVYHGMSWLASSGLDVVVDRSPIQEFLATL